MQSGISASQELHAAFKKLVASSEQRGLLCTIVEESLKPYAVLEPASSSFDDDLVSLLEPHLRGNDRVTLYIILRRYDISSTAPFVAITYIPDSAPVRAKMLFASTRLTLVRELGVERFRETIFVTTPEELTADGFKKHDQHVNLEAPLTEEERSLGEVKRQEAEESRGMQDRKSHVMSSLSIPASDEVIEILTDLSKSNDNATLDENVNLIQLKINTKSETLELDSKTCTPIGKLGASISMTSPRFSFYRYVHTHNNDRVSSILFIYTIPSGSKLLERMLYAASSRSVQQFAEQTIGLKITKKIVESNPQEITEQSIISDLYPAPTKVTQTFDRPRRPGRISRAN